MESKKIKILAIDDNSDNLITIKALIYEAFENALIFTALSGIKGLKLAATEDPDVILLDIVMPGMDGFEVCQRLKADNKLSDIPVVFVTALKGDKESRIRGLEVGAEAFLAKPIDESELTAQIRAMVKIKASNIEKHNEKERLAALVAERTRELKENHVATLNLLDDLKNENEARRKSEEALRESEEKYRSLVQYSSDPIFSYNPDETYRFVNEAFAKTFAKTPDDIIGKSPYDILPHNEAEKRLMQARNVFKTGKKDEIDVKVVTKTGDVQYLLTMADPIKDVQGVVLYVTCISKDITGRKLAEEKLRHVARLYALHSQINQAIVHTREQEELFQKICQVAVEFGQFRMARVGLFDESDNKIIPVISAGHDDGYLDHLHIIPGDKEYGEGPSGQAFYEKNVIFCNDIANDPKMLPWRAEALKRGYRSSCAVPFQRNGKNIGELALYASESEFFNEDELKLLLKIGEEISFALDAISSENERTQIEEALVESEAKYREFVDNSPEAIAIYSEGIVVYVNNECVRLMRAKTRAELLGLPVIEFIHPDNRAIVLERMMNVAQTGIDISLAPVEEKYIRLDGTAISVEVKAMPILLDNKPAIQLSARDITDRKLIEASLESSRTELKAIYDNAPVMMCLVNEDRRILFANHAFTELTSTIEIDLKGGQVGGVVGCINSLDDPRGCGYGNNCKNCELRLAMEDTFNTGIGHRDIEYHSTPMFNGERREVSLLGSTAIIKNNEEKNLLLCLHDITDRKRAEKELMEQKHFFEQMFMQSSVSTQILDREGWCEKINPKLSQLFGVDPKHIEGKVYNIFNDEAVIKGGIIPNLEKVFVKGQTAEWEVFFDIGLAADSQDIVVHDKKKVWFNNWAYPIFEQNGEISHVIIQHNDITDRKQSEEALQKSEMFLRTFIENTPFEIWARDVNNVGILENKKMIDHFGSQLGQTPISNSNKEPEITQLWESNNKRAFNGEMIDEIVKYKIDNHPYIYQQIIFPIYNNEIIIGIAGFNIDITERVQIEEELKESQSLYFSFIEQLPNAIFRKDREGRFLLVNSQFCKLKGLTKEDLIGNTPKEVADREIASGGEQVYAFKYANTGEDIHELILQTGKSFETEEVYSISNGDKQYMHVVRMPVVDSSGIIIGSQGIMFDVTERKRVEDALNNSEEQLKQFAAHLQNIREEERTGLAREIHDDLGQILVAMKIDLGLMKQKVLKNIDLAFLEDITTKFDNLFNLLDNTIKTTRRIMTGLRPEVLELLGFVEATKLYAIDFQERHNIHCKFESTLTKLVITSQQSVALFRILQEALTNVVRHAMATEVKVLLSIHNNKLIMEIIDNGIGFDQKYKGRSDSYGMIGMKERVFLLEGELTIKGETGKGTTVKIEMPYISDQLTVIS